MDCMTLTLEIPLEFLSDPVMVDHYLERFDEEARHVIEVWNDENADVECEDG